MTSTSSETVNFKLNGKEVSVPKGWTVMQAAKRENVDIPHFCWHPGLTIAGVCRFCMVKVAGRPKLEIACNLTAADGMEVSTDTEDVKEAHKWALEFHLVNHPLDCPICDQAGECGLQDFYMSVGKYHSQMDRPKVLKPKALDVGSDLVLDTERCILCSRCVRFEEEVTKTGALGIFDRGDRAIIGTYDEEKIEHNYQGNLVDICPVGAFTQKSFRFKQRVWFLKETSSVCPGCSTGCQISVHGKPEVRRYFRIKPEESDVNGHWVCDKGRSLYSHLNPEERLSKAWCQDTSGNKSRVLVHEAIEALALKIKDTEPTDIALLLTAHYTVEEYQALLSLFVKKLKVKNVLQWREPTENRDEFDNILLRGDRNPNTKGLLAELEKFGIQKTTPENEFDKLANLNPKLVIALAPEVLDGFQSAEQNVRSLGELPYVSLWTTSLDLGHLEGPKQAIPLKGFAEKTGHFVNFRGKERTLQECFTPAVSEARDVVELTAMLSEKLSIAT